jgi:hypothetical protein
VNVVACEQALTSRIFVKAAKEMQERVTKYKETIAVSHTEDGAY